MSKVLMLVAMAMGFMLSGCGEKLAVTTYKNGQYSGKPDTQPWAGDQFKGDRMAWEKAIKARTDGQNEYSR